MLPMLAMLILLMLVKLPEEINAAVYYTAAASAAASYDGAAAASVDAKAAAYCNAFSTADAHLAAATESLHLPLCFMDFFPSDAFLDALASLEELFVTDWLTDSLME